MRKKGDESMEKNILKVFNFGNLLEDIFTNENMKRNYDEFIGENKNIISLDPEDISKLLKEIKRKEEIEKIFNLSMFLGEHWDLEVLHFFDESLIDSSFKISLKKNRIIFEE